MTQHTTTPELDQRDVAWLRPVTNYLTAKGFACPSFPMTPDCLYTFAAELGYVLNEHVLMQEHGEIYPAYTVGDVRRLQGQLEKHGYWQTFPNAAHDSKKSVDQLAREVAQWLESLHANYRKAWATACDARFLLMNLAAANDAATQATLLAAATHKFGCTPVKSTAFWPQLCEDVATMTQVFDSEPGSKAF